MNLKPVFTPTIRKSYQVIGKSLIFRDARINDAGFIFSLRTDKKKSRHLSTVETDIDVQRRWLESYSSRSSEAYFIIEYQGKPVGTVRLYDARGDSFCWGSWILLDGLPFHTSIESALMVYAYAMDHLRFTNAHFEVRKGNERVWQFHERFGAKRVTETVHEYLYVLQNDSIEAARLRYIKFLPEGVKVLDHENNHK